MRSLLKSYVNKNKEKFNNKIIYEMREEPLVPYIVDIFKSLESIPYITFMGYEYENDYSKMDLNKINKKTTKMKIKDENLKLMNIDESLLGRLIIRLKIDFREETRDVEIRLLLPEKYKKYYYLLNGKKYYPIYQLVDNSTYSRKDSIVLKSILLPIIVKRKMVKGETDVPMYYLNLFNREINIMLFYLSEFGFEETLKYFNIDKSIIDIKSSEKNVEYDDYIYCYSEKKKYVLEVKRKFYEKDGFVRNLVFLLWELINEKTFNLDEIENKKYWVSCLGSLFNSNKILSYEKGRNVMVSFKRILDNITKRNLKLYKCNKKDMFSVVKWMITNFSGLKMKNNLDLKNKRLRLNEYIASYVSKAVADKVNRILTKTKLPDIDYIANQFNMKQDHLITELQKSPLLRYDDMVNDMDLINSLRVSSKGPSALGEKSGKSINMKYKDIHPSQVGRIDLNFTSSSSPGVTGMLVPFVEMDGLYFDSSMEVQNWEYEFYNIKKDIMESENKHLFVEFNIPDEETYFHIKEEVDKLRDEFKVKIKRVDRTIILKIGKKKKNIVLDVTI